MADDSRNVQFCTKLFLENIDSVEAIVNMSVAGLMKNIYSFLDVLQKAQSPAAQGWTEQDIKNALRWAEYCEKVYSQSIGKLYAESLDRQIRTLGQLPWALRDVDITMEYLKDATLLIRKALLQNPYLPEDLFTAVLKMARDTDDKKAIVKVLHNIIVPKMGVHQVLLLTRKLLARNKADEHDTPSEGKELCLESEAVLLHRHMKYACRTCMNHSRLKSYLNQQLEGIVGERSGMTIILRSLLQEDGNHLHHKLMIDWLQEQIQTGQNSRYSIGECSPDLLCSVARVYSSFADSYMKWLVEWASHMTIRYTPHQRPGYIYCSKSDHFFSFNNFAGHFVKLLTGPAINRKAVIALVLSKSQESEVSVWYELRKYLVRNI